MKTFLSLCFFFFLTFFISAQDIPKSELEEIVVSATKSETPLLEIASSIDIIGQEQFKASKKSSVIEYLRDVKGISLTQPGGMGKVSSVFIRGANSNHTLVMIDGIEVNDPSSPGNAFDFTTLNIDNIERIEIIRGPQSTLYGADAMSGVINIITKSGEGETKISLIGEYGSNNFVKSSTGISGRNEQFSYSVGSTYIGTDGISASSSKYGNNEKDNYYNYNFNSKLGYYFSEDFLLIGYFKYNFAETGLDQTEQFGDDPNYTYDIEENLFSLSGTKKWLDQKIESKLSASLLRRVSHAIDKIDAAHPQTSSYQFNNASRIKIDFQNDYNLSKSNKIVAVFEYENEKAATEFRSDGLFGKYESIFPQNEMNTKSFSLLNQFNYDGFFFSSVGLRVDKNSQFGTNITYKLAPAIYISDLKTKLRFTIGSGLKSPSLYNLFDPAFGNAELKPEESLGWDFGLDFFASDKISFGFTYFRTNYKGLIDYNQFFIPINIAKVKTYGAELELKAVDIYGFNININYTYLVAEDEGQPAESNELIRRPDNKLNFNMAYKFTEELLLNLTYKIVGRRYDRNFSTFPSTRVELPKYSLLNLSASYSLTTFMEFYLRVDNVFDEYYEDALFLGNYGRSIYTGINLTL
ncbi:MAG: TonB-dependent receptor [Melioribacteraceae bacterium]|nr:TonB-dependent receptor [Melioribacteraceae bacterium]